MLYFFNWNQILHVFMRKLKKLIIKSKIKLNKKLNLIDGCCLREHLVVQNDISKEFSISPDGSVEFCYEDILKYLIYLNDIPVEYSDGMMEKFCYENNIDGSFDDRNYLNIHSIDRYLMNYNLSLKHIEMNSSSDIEYINSAWQKIDQQTLSQIIIHYEDHFMYVLKIANRYFLLLPEYRDAIPHTREELIHFVQERNCHAFLVDKMKDDICLKEGFHLDLYGGGKRKLLSDSEDSDDLLTMVPRKKQKCSKKDSHVDTDDEKEPEESLVECCLREIDEEDEEKEMLRKKKKQKVSEKRKKQMRANYQKNKEKISQKDKKRYQKNKKKISQKYQKNKKKIAKQRTEYGQKNKEKISQNKKKVYDMNKKKISKQRKEYGAANKENISQKKKEYYENNKEVISQKRVEERIKNPEIFKKRNDLYYASHKEELHDKYYEKRPDILKAKNVNDYAGKYLSKLITRNIYREWKIEEYQEIQDIFTQNEKFEEFFQLRLENVKSFLEKEWLTFGFSEDKDNVQKDAKLEEKTWLRKRCSQALKLMKRKDRIVNLRKLLKDTLQLHDGGGWHKNGRPGIDYNACPDCHSQRFPAETFNKCCGNGNMKTLIKEVQNTKQSDHPFSKYLFKVSEKSGIFKKNIISLNNLFAYASRCIAKNKDKKKKNKKKKKKIPNYGAKATVKVNNDVYYCLPEKLVSDEDPRFASVFFLDDVQQLQRRLVLAKEKKCPVYKGITSKRQKKIMDNLIKEIQDTILAKSYLVKQFKMLKDKIEAEPNVKFVLTFKQKYTKPRADHKGIYNNPRNNILCAFVPDGFKKSKKMSVVYPQSPTGKLQYVKELDRQFDPLHYTLLFPTGTLGWGLKLKQQLKKKEKISCEKFYRFHLQERFEKLDEPNELGQMYDFTKPTNERLYGGRLTLQYMVDMAIKVDNNNLRFHADNKNQKNYRKMDYKGLLDAMADGKDLKEVGQKKILPSSYAHGRRCYIERYRDAMAIVSRFGKPDLFITMTGNQNWKEVDRLLNGRKKVNCVHITNRVFALKLKELMIDITEKEVFGRIIGKVWVIEYQNRGIPHAHICLILHPYDKPKNNKAIDRMIWAEIPPNIYEDEVEALQAKSKPLQKQINKLKSKKRKLKKIRFEENRHDSEEDTDTEMKSIVDQIEDLTEKLQVVRNEKDELSEKNLHDFVVSRHIHAPCGSSIIGGKKKSCMNAKKTCKSRFPKGKFTKTNKSVQGFTDYRRRAPGQGSPGPTVEKWYNGGKDGSGKIIKTKFIIDNAWVVSYNPALLMKYHCHLNVEYCGAVSAIKYLYKYMFKGTDRGCVEIKEEENEIAMHKFGRVMSANEGHYRMACFKLHDLQPRVERLSYFIPSKKNITFNVELSDLENKEEIEKQFEGEKMIQWFRLNQKEREAFEKLEKIIKEKEVDVEETKDFMELVPHLMEKKLDQLEKKFQEDMEDMQNEIKEEIGWKLQEPYAFNLRYIDLPLQYRWDEKKWKRYKRKVKPSAPRLYTAHLGSDKFYLRELLLHVTGKEEFQDFYKVKNDDGSVTTFDYMKDVCVHLGLVNDDKEYFKTMEECSKFKFGRGMRQLYCTILSTEEKFSKAGELWELYKDHMVDDFFPEKTRLEDFGPTELEKYYQMALRDIRDTIVANGKDFKKIRGLPEIVNVKNFTKEFIAETIYFDNIEELQEIWEENRGNMNADQAHIFDKVQRKLETGEQIIQMIDAPAGTGKTYVLGSIAAYVRSNKNICLNSAFSGVAAQLLEGGVTIHKRFNMRINMAPDINCSINKDSTIAKLLCKCHMILMDEVVMMDKIDLERISSTLKFLTGVDKPFGGKNVIIAGDFRQILPVKPNDFETMEACIKESRLWKYFDQDPLVINERVNSMRRKGLEPDEEYADWLLKVGVNELPNYEIPNLDPDVSSFIKLPEKLIDHKSESLEGFIENMYPDMGNETTPTIILTSINENVHKINDMCLERFPGEYEAPFVSVDEVLDTTQGHLYSSDDLNNMNPNSLPRHEIRLKKNSPVMLMRNINVREGLANGTRLKVLQCMERSIFCEICTGPDHFVGKKVFIPKLFITNDNDDYFQMKRYQLPIRVCFAMTINKAQGQTLQKVGLYMPKPCFAHGQLYVALSRVTHPKFLQLFIPHNAENHGKYDGDFYTQNIVHRNILEDEIERFKGRFPDCEPHSVTTKMFIQSENNENNDGNFHDPFFNPWGAIDPNVTENIRSEDFNDMMNDFGMEENNEINNEEHEFLHENDEELINYDYDDEDQFGDFFRNTEEDPWASLSKSEYAQIMHNSSQSFGNDSDHDPWDSLTKTEFAEIMEDPYEFPWDHIPDQNPESNYTQNINTMDMDIVDNLSQNVEKMDLEGN